MDALRLVTCAVAVGEVVPPGLGLTTSTAMVVTPPPTGMVACNSVAETKVVVAVTPAACTGLRAGDEAGAHDVEQAGALRRTAA